MREKERNGNNALNEGAIRVPEPNVSSNDGGDGGRETRYSSREKAFRRLLALVLASAVRLPRELVLHVLSCPCSSDRQGFTIISEKAQNILADGSTISHLPFTAYLGLRHKLDEILTAVPFRRSQNHMTHFCQCSRRINTFLTGSHQSRA